MRVLVTGGGGFLGGAIVRQLAARGDSVRSFSRSQHRSIDSLLVEQIQGDLASATAVAQAVAGCDAVIHVAAKAGVWGPTAEFELANIVGTRHVIAACRQHGVRKLVFTSTPSVVGAGHDIEGGNESLPYPAKYLADYPRTKAIAEREVLAANGPQLATVALRPHLIFGPGDPHLIPRLLARARAGKLRIIGSGKSKVDFTFVDDAAEAHLLALDRLTPGSPICGKAYFISQGDPVELWPFVNQILDLAGLPPVKKHVPFRVAYVAGAMFEFWYRSLRLSGEPPLTRFVVAQLAHSHWFDLSAARRDLDYSPRNLTADYLIRLETWLGVVAKSYGEIG
jgi:nucleoside-diphosphate-sugar epimerase